MELALFHVQVALGHLALSWALWTGLRLLTRGRSFREEDPLSEAPFPTRISNMFLVVNMGALILMTLAAQGGGQTDGYEAAVLGMVTLFAGYLAALVIGTVSAVRAPSLQALFTACYSAAALGFAMLALMAIGSGSPV